MLQLLDILGGCLPGACGNNPPVPTPNELLDYALALLICGCVLLAAAVVFGVVLHGMRGRKTWRSKRLILSTMLACAALLLADRARGAYEYYAHTPGAWPNPNNYPPGGMPAPFAATGYGLAAMLMVMLTAVFALSAGFTVAEALLRIARHDGRH